MVLLCARGKLPSPESHFCESPFPYCLSAASPRFSVAFPPRVFVPPIAFPPRVPVFPSPFRRESPFLSRLSSSLCSTIRLFTNSLSTAAFPQVLVTQSLFHQSPFHRRLSSSPRHPVAFLPIAFPPSPFLKSSSPSRLSSSPHHPVAFPPVAFPPSPFHRRLSISCSPSTQSRPWLRKTHLAKDRLEQRRGVCDVGVGVDDELEAAGRLKEVHLVRPCGVVSQSNLPDAKRGAG